MAHAHPVGIDLGTTFSAAAYVDADGATRMIPNADGAVLTPSVVLFEEAATFVGKDALDQGEFAHDRIAETAKRDMGRSHYRRPIHGRALPPEVIQGMILRTLRDDVARAIGEDFKAVITVPAYFDEVRRSATANAGQMSGLDVLDIVNEPTAAALAFGEKLGYLDVTGAPRDALTILVYDLGGGTFDVTIIRLAPGDIVTLATDGDVELGGFNWDMKLVDHVLARFRAAHPDCPPPDDASLLRLRRRAEQAKHELSENMNVTISFGHAGDAIDVEITREEFEAMASELVERTLFTTRQTLKAAGLLWGDIDRLLLVGGSTRLPMIRERLMEDSKLQPDANVHPDEAVARGAAIFARFLLGKRGEFGIPPQLSITDVNAHSLGIEGINQQTLRKENVFLIDRNTPLPFEKRRTFVTKKFGQDSVDIRLLEGESKSPEHCVPLARARILNLPPGLPKGTKIDVCYRYETNGRLSVNAQIAEAGPAAIIELERVRDLPEKRLVKWKKVICRDGGFGDFSELVANWTADELDPPAASPPQQKAATNSNEPAKRRSLEPATPDGAPRAASDTLKRALRGPLHDDANKRSPAAETSSEFGPTMYETPNALADTQRFDAALIETKRIANREPPPRDAAGWGDYRPATAPEPAAAIQTTPTAVAAQPRRRAGRTLAEHAVFWIGLLVFSLLGLLSGFMVLYLKKSDKSIVETLREIFS